MDSPFEELDDLSTSACPFCMDPTITSSSQKPSEHCHYRRHPSKRPDYE